MLTKVAEYQIILRGAPLSTYLYGWAWLDDLGCMLLPAGIELLLVQLDGYASPIGWGLGSSLGSFGDGSGYAAGNPLQRVHLPGHAFDPIQDCTTGGAGANSFGVLEDRIIYGGWDGVHSRMLDGSAGPMMSVPGSGVSGDDLWLAVPGGGLGSKWWVHSGGAFGMVHYFQLFDLTTGQYVKGTKVGIPGPLAAVCYARKHDLFVGLRYGQWVNGMLPSYIEIYANDPVPARLSTPVLGGAARQGARTSVTCQLTGDVGEPCSDHLVTFSATGGTVEQAEVMTDRDGVASTVIVIGDPGTLNVTASWG